MQQEPIFGSPNEIEFMGRNPTVFFSHLPLVTDKKSRRVEKFSQVIASGIYFDGQENKTLQKRLLKFLGDKGFLTTLASGHDALVFALQALKLKPTDEVIFPVNAYPTAFPVALSGAIPVPCDVDENGQIDIEKLKRKITKKTRAVVVVHLYGLTGDIEEVGNLARNHNITLIEDCAQSLGTTFREKPLGTFGDISCFSFYPTKNLGCLGDGGAIWTNNKSFYNFFVRAKSYGERKRYESEFISFHSRLPEVQAAILNLYMNTVKRYFKKRKSLFKLYKEKLADIKDVRVLNSHALSDPVPYILVIDVPNRTKLQTFLKRRGIPSLIHYPIPIHLVKAFASLGYIRGDFPVAEYLSERILTLPFHQQLSEKTLNRIVQSIYDFYA